MENLYDVIVIGGGPAGLTSAIYLARARYRVLVVEKEKFGGQITITSEIVNYPGVELSSGTELTESMRQQAENFGAEFAVDNVISMDLKDTIKVLKTENGREYKTLGIVLAVGANPRKIGFKGEKEFQGRGVAYCATCDGEFFTGREVLVIGGGFAAVEEAMFLTKYASQVTIIVREEDFTCAKGVSDQLSNYPDIKVRFETEVLEVYGDGIVKGAKIKDNKTGEVSVYEAKDGGSIGVFVFVGYEPDTKWFANLIELNEQGYIVTDENRKTSIDGVYGAGDVCIKNLRQVVTAVADGAIAATSLERYVSETREKLGLKKAEIKTPAKKPAKKKRAAEKKDKDEGFIDSEMMEKLKDVFEKFEKDITVAAVTNGRGVSEELAGFVNELSGVNAKVKVKLEESAVENPYIDIRVEGKPVGIRYLSVPGGHEFNSFVIAMYNSAGPGQQLSETVEDRIKALNGKHTIKVMATLSCTNCPDVVMGTQKIAAINEGFDAEMYDLSKFPDIKEKYDIMAVPCMIIDDKHVFFGKQSLPDILNNIESVL